MEMLLIVPLLGWAVYELTQHTANTPAGVLLWLLVYIPLAVALVLALTGGLLMLGCLGRTC